MEVEGFRTGIYQRLEVHDVPFETVEQFGPHHPVPVGGRIGIGFGKENVGYTQVGFCLQFFFLNFNISLPFVYFHESDLFQILTTRC